MIDQFNPYGIWQKITKPKPVKPKKMSAFVLRQKMLTHRIQPIMVWDSSPVMVRGRLKGQTYVRKLHGALPNGKHARNDRKINASSERI